MSLEPELRGASDAMLTNLDRLRTLEQEKRTLPLDSPRLVELAKEIEQLAGTVLGVSDRQTELAHEANRAADRGEVAGSASIDSISPPRDVHTVLAEWREAERRLTQLQPDSVEASTARAEIRALREEYRRAHDAAVRRTDTAGDGRQRVT